MFELVFEIVNLLLQSLDLSTPVSPAAEGYKTGTNYFKACGSVCVATALFGPLRFVQRPPRCWQF
jgi:hypothetical protein